MNDFLILVINPGSTSTKVAVFQNENNILSLDLKHSPDDLAQFKKVTDQFKFRKDLIIKSLTDHGININDLNIVMGRGGLIKPVKSGVYHVNFKMRKDLVNTSNGEHPSNLGGLIAAEIAGTIPGTKAYIADPIVVDEFNDVSRISGHPQFERKSIFHALNQKAIARHYAADQNKKYEELNLIVAHLGGGITIGAHRKGLVIDVNSGIDGEGPFSPQRSGTLPVGDLVRYCFSGKSTEKEVLKMINGNGGMLAYTGKTNVLDVIKMIQAGDKKAEVVYKALGFQIAKEIGAMSTVLFGEVDAILLTGGLAYCEELMDNVITRVKHLAPVFLYPGEDEMKALAMNGLMVLRGEIEAGIY